MRKSQPPSKKRRTKPVAKKRAEDFAGGSAFLCKLDGFHPANGLSVSEAERLALLLEEAGEVVQAIGKVLRHGYESWNPNDPRRTSNRESLERELGDMAAAIQLMTGRRDLNAAFIKQCQVDKLKKVGQYLHHQPSEG